MSVLIHWPFVSIVSIVSIVSFVSVAAFSGL
jgi:hypothetical protein